MEDEDLGLSVKVGARGVAEHVQNVLVANLFVVAGVKRPALAVAHQHHDARVQLPVASVVAEREQLLQEDLGKAVS